jgi:hypothetical protein
MISLVALVVCLSFVSSENLHSNLEFMQNILTQIMYSGVCHFLLFWHGCHSMADDVWGTVLCLTLYNNRDFLVPLKSTKCNVKLKLGSKYLDLGRCFTYPKTSCKLLYTVDQILPVSIKSLGGSFATLANWLTSFAITMTANLLLTWSVGGPHFDASLLPMVGLRTMISDAGYFFQIQQAPSYPTWLSALSLSCSSLFGCRRQREKL